MNRAYQREALPIYDSEESVCGCCWDPTPIGEHLLLWGKASEKLGFPFQGMVGPSYRTCGGTAVVLIGCVAGWTCVMLLVLETPKRWILAAVGLGLTALTLLFMGLVGCSNPGIVFRDSAPDVTEAGSREAGARGDSNLGVGGLVVGKVVSAPLHDERLATAASADAGMLAAPPLGLGSVGSASGSAKYRGRGAPVECGKCAMMRPPGARHCNECNACIKGLDHHCPFTGQCIGRNNLKVFRVFVFFMWLTIVFVAGTLVLTLVLRVVGVTL